MLGNLKQLTKEENITFEELVEEWLLYKKQQIKESSYFRYKYIANKYLLEIFENIHIKELENYDLNILVNELLKKYNAKTVRSIVIELKSILNYSQKKYMLNLKTDLIVIPKVKAKRIKILDKNEENIIKNFCYNSLELRDIGLLICLYTGIRLGEICGLKWKDIDLKNGLIFVNRTIERVYVGSKNTMIYIGEPKSKSSIRAVPIVNNLSKILQEIKEKNQFEDDMYFLSGKEKRFIEPRNYQYWFRKRLEKLNIPMNNFHILRHTFATNCIRIGMDIKSLSEILGHSSVSVTLNRYVHSSYEVQKDYLEKLN